LEINIQNKRYKMMIDILQIRNYNSNQKRFFFSCNVLLSFSVIYYEGLIFGYYAH